MAMGGNVPMPVGNGNLTYINGTSFSSPILAGAAACLWQSQLAYTNMDIFTAIEQSAHLSQNPNKDYGYGIPNMYMAHFLVTGVEEVAKTEASVLYPNPAQNWVSIIGNTSPMDVTIYNALGQLVLAQPQVSGGFDVSNLTPGVYMVTMQSEQNTLHTRLVIQE
jgi:subtilisin family serine protease